MCQQQWECPQKGGNVYNSGEMSTTVGENVHDSGVNVRNSGDIEYIYALRNVRLEIVIRKSAWITSESKDH